MNKDKYLNEEVVEVPKDYSKNNYSRSNLLKMIKIFSLVLVVIVFSISIIDISKNILNLQKHKENKTYEKLVAEDYLKDPKNVVRDTETYEKPGETEDRKVVQEIPVLSEKANVYILNSGKAYKFNEETNELVLLLDIGDIKQIFVDQENEKLLYLSNGEIYSFDIQNEGVTKITDTLGKIDSFIVSPNKDKILYYYIDSYTGCCGNPEPTIPLKSMYITDMDGEGYFKVNYPPKIDENVYYYSRASLEDWYPSGDKILVRGHGILDTTGNFWEIDILENTIKKFDIYGDYEIDYMPDFIFSPDGKKILIADEYSSGLEGIWTVDMDGSNLQQISERGISSWEIWSPDSSKVAGQGPPVSSNDIAGGESFLVFDLNGNLVYEEFTKTGGGFIVDSWSADSRFIVADQYPYKSNYRYLLTIFDIMEGSKVELRSEIYDRDEDIDYDFVSIAPSNLVYFVKNWKEGKSVIKSELWYFDLSTNKMTQVMVSDTYVSVVY